MFERSYGKSSGKVGRMLEIQQYREGSASGLLTNGNIRSKSLISSACECSDIASRIYTYIIRMNTAEGIFIMIYAYASELNAAKLKMLLTYLKRSPRINVEIK